MWQQENMAVANVIKTALSMFLIVIQLETKVYLMVSEYLYSISVLNIMWNHISFLF